MSGARSRFDARAFKRVYSAPIFAPTDCPNYLTYADFAQYQWYARLLAPVLLATGGGPLYVGNRLETLRGESPCETWMVVRYKNHRRMLAMIANPYYAWVNRFRERGTARLELGFTEPRDPRSGLETHRFVLGVHVATRDPNDLFARLQALAAAASLPVVYESELRLGFEFVVAPRPCDPNPLTYPVTAALGAAAPEPLRAFATGDALAKLLDSATERACVQLYRRGGTRDYLRFGGAAPHPSAALPSVR